MNFKQGTQNWKMPLNDSKCTVLHIGRNNPKHTYYLEQKPVTAVVKQKDLGIIITSDLKWELHITTLTKKANSLIYLIQKSFTVVQGNGLKNLQVSRANSSMLIQSGTLTT